MCTVAVECYSLQFLYLTSSKELRRKKHTCPVSPLEVTLVRVRACNIGAGAAAAVASLRSEVVRHSSLTSGSQDPFHHP